MDGCSFSDRRNNPQLRSVVIAVPVRNEEARVERLLHSLDAAAQCCDLPVVALILANNCDDATEKVALACRMRHVAVQVRSVTLPPAIASAGQARRMAMNMAWRPDALMMTTDGDAQPYPDWIASALRAARCGADVVCGQVTANVDHVLATPSGIRITRAEASYADVLHRVRHLGDRMRGDQGPMRPHYVESGASVAITSAALRRIGGVPAVPSSEDRAMVHRADLCGLRIVYADDMTAQVSARLYGRAKGGMADCLRQRMSQPDPLADQAMLPLAVLRRLWTLMRQDPSIRWPTREKPTGPRLRASDLERDLPHLVQFHAECAAQVAAPADARISLGAA